MRDDGGPAFPRPATRITERERTGRITEQQGMSLRDWFAGQALSSMLGPNLTTNKVSVIARDAYRIADAMIDERAKEENA